MVLEEAVSILYMKPKLPPEAYLFKSIIFIVAAKLALWRAFNGGIIWFVVILANHYTNGNKTILKVSKARRAMESSVSSLGHCFSQRNLAAFLVNFYGFVVSNVSNVSNVSEMVKNIFNFALALLLTCIKSPPATKHRIIRRRRLACANLDVYPHSNTFLSKRERLWFPWRKTLLHIYLHY